MTLPRALAALLVAVLLLPACDSAETFSIGGTYSGLSNTQEGVPETTLTLTIPATESGGTFSFTGAGVQGGSTFSTSGTGAYDHPAITLTVEGESIEGTVSEDGGTLTLDDDTGLGAFTLRRR